MQWTIPLPVKRGREANNWIAGKKYEAGHCLPVCLYGLSLRYKTGCKNKGKNGVLIILGKKLITRILNRTQSNPEKRFLHFGIKNIPGLSEKKLRPLPELLRDCLLLPALGPVRVSSFSSFSFSNIFYPEQSNLHFLPPFRLRLWPLLRLR